MLKDKQDRAPLPDRLLFWIGVVSLIAAVTLIIIDSMSCSDIQVHGINVCVSNGWVIR